MTQLSDVLEPVVSSRPQSADIVYVDLSAIDTDTKTITGARVLSSDNAPSRARQILKAGDVLVSTVRPNLNGVAIVPDELDGSIGSTGFTVLRSRSGALDARYLFHWVQTELFISSMVRLATGASYPAVSDAIVKGSELPLPPLPEQRRIASILDLADSLRAANNQALAQAEDIRGALFVERFGREPGAVGGEVRKLGDLATIASGSTPDRSRPEYFDGEIPWVKTTEVRGGVIFDTSERVTASGQRAARLRLYPRGSLIVAMYGQGKTRGQVAMLGIDAAVNQACAVIIPNESVNGQFLFEHLRLSYERLRSKGRGGNQANLNLGLVADLDVRSPALELQEELVAKLEKVEHVTELLLRRARLLDDAFKSVQHKAFTAQLGSA